MSQRIHREEEYRSVTEKLGQQKEKHQKLETGILGVKKKFTKRLIVKNWNQKVWEIAEMTQ